MSSLASWGSALAHAGGKALSWEMGRDRVGDYIRTKRLTRSGKGVLRVYQDPH